MWLPLQRPIYPRDADRKKEVKDDKSQATTKQKKNNADDNQQPQEAAVETNVTAAQPAKRRGRKPKADSPQAETAELEQQADDNQPAEAQQPDGEQQPKNVAAVLHATRVHRKLTILANNSRPKPRFRLKILRLKP